MRIHLVRHGEVANPNHVVYGDLPGFDLSPAGVRQAHATAEHLSTMPIAAVIASPLARAMQTATAIARRHGLSPIPDRRLIETRQFPHWTGRRWDEVLADHPDEFAAYLEDAGSAPSTGEGLVAVVERVTGALADRAVEDGELVAVGHQDPTQATRLHLTGRPLSSLRVDPPGHGAVITLERTTKGWVEVAIWEPNP